MLFLVKLYFARKYKPFTESFKTTASVIVPIYNESPQVLEKLLSSLLANINDITEIIMVVDPRDEKSFQFLQKWKEDNRVEKMKVVMAEGKGKRVAEAMGIKMATGEVVVIMDSDTRLVGSNVIAELLKPFKDPLVGGVTSNQRINMNPHKTIKKRLSDWMENMRCLLSFPAMSVKGVVGCLPGRCVAFRRSILLPYLDRDFLNERFLGVRCETGDDRCLTNIVLKNGYKTVYQSSAKVVTEVPESWRKYIKQQLRWMRSSRRETIMNLRWMIRKPFILPFIFISDILVPILFFAVVVNAFLNMIFHWDITLIAHDTILHTVLGGFLFGLLGMIISIGLRQSPHLRRNLHELKLLPVYIFWGTFVLSPLCIYALFTIRSQDWMTR